MFTVFAGALLALGDVQPPVRPPPFSKKAARVAGLLETRVTNEFKRCGYARTYSNGRYVEAMGTARYSAKWNLARSATNNALTVCRGLRQALRNQKDFLLEVIQHGTKPDVRAATFRLDTVANELSALESFFSTETLRYRDLAAIGWGTPHCVSGSLESLSPPEIICPALSGNAAK